MDKVEADFILRKKEYAFIVKSANFKRQKEFIFIKGNKS